MRVFIFETSTLAGRICVLAFQLVRHFAPWYRYFLPDLSTRNYRKCIDKRSLRSVSSAECFVATHEGKDCHSETLLLQKCLLSSKKQNEVLNTRINYNTQYLHTYICCCPTYWTVWNSIASPMIAQIWSKMATALTHSFTIMLSR